MIKYVTTFAILFAMIACGNDKPSTGAAVDQPVSMVADDITTHPDYDPGLSLIVANDCYTCHKVDEKLIGPPYRDVANKYATHPEAVELLADKVMNGGSGVWGDVAMAAHPKLSKEDAVKMVKYIMLLKQ